MKKTIVGLIAGSIVLLSLLPSMGQANDTKAPDPNQFLIDHKIDQEMSPITEESIRESEAETEKYKPLHEMYDKLFKGQVSLAEMIAFEQDFYRRVDPAVLENKEAVLASGPIVREALKRSGVADKVGLTQSKTPSQAKASGIRAVQVNGAPLEEDKIAKCFYLTSQGQTMARADFWEDLSLAVTIKGDQVTLTNGDGLTMVWRLNEKAYELNQKTVPATASPVKKDKQIYLPVRDMMTALGSVHWNGEQRSLALIYDYSTYLTPPKVSVKKNIIVSKVIADLKDKDAGKLPIDVDENNRLIYAKTDDSGELLSLHDADGKDVLSPQKANHVLLYDGYFLQEGAKVWIEYPKADGGKWSLYCQEKAETPQQVASGQMENGIGFKDLLRHISVTKDHIAYMTLKPNGTEPILHLYDRKTHQTETIAELPAGSSPANPSVEGKILVWGDSHVIWPEGDYGRIMLKDMDNNQTQFITKGANLQDPVKRGNDVIAVFRPHGHNFIPQADGTDKGAESWHYDIEKGRWDYRIDNSLSFFDGGAKETYMVAGAAFVADGLTALKAEGTQDKRAIPIVNWHTGEAQLLTDEKGDIVYIEEASPTDKNNKPYYLRWRVARNGWIQLFGKDSSGNAIEKIISVQPK